MDNFRRILEDSVATGENIGISARITHKGKDLFRGAAGYADKENNVPLTCDSLFRVFSSTKIIIAVAALRLFEQGYFALDDPVAKYLPMFKDLKVISYTGDGQRTTVPARTPVTIRHLFTMTAGYSYQIPVALFNAPRHFEDARALTEQILGDAVCQPKLTSDKMLEAIASIPLAFEPGTEWLYGVCSDVLAALVETIVQKPFGTHLKEEYFAPLGMKDTSFRPNPEQLKRLAVLYDFSNPQNPVPFDTSTFYISHRPDSTNEHLVGALYSTLDDFSVFLQMMANDGIHEGRRYIGKNTLKAMGSDQLLDHQRACLHRTRFITGAASWGLMCRVTTKLAGSNPYLMPGSYGWGGWAGTQTSIDPNHGLTITMMVQRAPHVSYLPMSRLMQTAYGMI
ncbi:MAG: beta-lactamase family protein [Oscillospiraceae bacterium]|nr:beta-lactamase family protein [Oscillospiraceae bacterium]